jgi:hypothetical protein
MSRSDGKISDAMATFIYEEGLSEPQQMKFKVDIGVDSLGGVLKQLLQRSPGTYPTLTTSTTMSSVSGTANAATTIASSVRFRMDSPGYYQYLGIDTPVFVSGTDSYTSTGKFSRTTDSPWATEFIFDTVDATGRFEVINLGKNAAIRVVVNDQYLTAGPTFKPPSNGSVYNSLVILGNPGVYKIRLEMDAGVAFRGINAGPTDTIRATPKKPFKIAIGGDSFTEPTVVDSTQNVCGWDGYGQKLSYLLDANVISCGSGGTGYVNPGTARYKMYDRITDMTSTNADVYMFALGINDYANSAATISAEALSCFNAIREYDENAPIVVVSPFWKGGFFTYPVNLLLTKDGIFNASSLVAGTYDIDVLTTNMDYNSSTTIGALALSAASGTATLSSTISYPLNTYLRIGTGTNSEVRRVISNTAVSGIYALGFNNNAFAGGGSALISNHAAGEALTPVGPGIYSGSGKQGTPVGNGNADRYTSSDATHPTILGHLNIAQCLFKELGRISTDLV